MENIKENEYCNNIINYIIDDMMNIFEGNNENLNFKLKKSVNNLMNINFFDNNIEFYQKIFNSFENIPFYKISLNRILPIINQRNFIIYLQYLKKIIIEAQNAYKNPIIKINISLIISYFAGDKGKEIINSDEYFEICIQELKNIYKINLNEITNLDNNWINEYQKSIKRFKRSQLSNINDAFLDIKSYYIKNNEFDKYDEIINILNDLNNNNNLEIENDIINNNKYKDYLDLYLEIKAKENGYNKNNNDFEEIKEKIKKHKFDFKDIFNLNVMNDKLYLLSSSLYSSLNILDNISDIFKEYKTNYESLINESKIDLSKDLNEILNKDNFYNKFKKILESKTVKDYLMNKRKFMDDNNSIIINNNNEEYDNDFSKGYQNFMNYYNNNKNCLKRLIIFKYLPKYKRAFVDLNIRTIINPLYIILTNLLNKDEKKKKEVLQSYLIIILIHEIAHLLKFMKDNNFSINCIPQTPNNKEGGQMFINYLFGIPIINSISYLQSIEINNEDNWDNINNLHKIFMNENTEDLKMKDDNNSYKINFYLSYNKEEEEENDNWYDIN